LVGVVVLVVSGPPSHDALSVCPEPVVVYQAQLFSLGKHFVEGADVQAAVLWPALEFPALCRESAKRAANAAQALESFVVKLAVWQPLCVDQLPDVILGEVDDRVYYDLSCSVAIFNRAAGRVVVIV